MIHDLLLAGTITVTQLSIIKLLMVVYELITGVPFSEWWNK